MSQKEKKKDNSKGKGGLDGQSQTKIYQAIVIASSQEDDFVSHDSGSPVCLQEVAGAPILDYVLKGLNSPKIKEIIVVSGNYKLQLEQYLSQYTLDKFPKRVEFMYAEGANSIGDYLREVESHQKVQEFFVLVHGGLMTNAKIDDILEEFERNMEIDNNMVMLKVFSKGSTLSEQRSGQDCEFVMLDEENRIMKLDNTSDKRVCLQGRQFLSQKTSGWSSVTSASTESDSTCTTLVCRSARPTCSRTSARTSTTRTNGSTWTSC